MAFINMGMSGGYGANLLAIFRTALKHASAANTKTIPVIVSMESNNDLEEEFSSFKSQVQEDLSVMKSQPNSSNSYRDCNYRGRTQGRGRPYQGKNK